MGEVVSRILDSPVSAYVLSFGFLGGAIMLALAWLHGKLDFSDRVWAILTLVCGAGGGVLIQETGLVVSPVANSLGGLILAAFIGATVAAAAAGFSAVDLRRSVMKSKDED